MASFGRPAVGFVSPTPVGFVTPDSGGFGSPTLLGFDTPARHTKTAGFDAAAVNEDAANVKVIAPLAVQTAELAQQVADAELAWTGEALSAALTVNRVANALLEVNPALRAIVDTLAPLFSGRRRKAA